METTELLQRVADEANRVVGGVRPDQLDAQTPCDDWKVRDLLVHITSGAQMFAIGAEQGSVPDDQLGPLMSATLADDYQGAFAAAVERARVAFLAPGVTDKEITLPFGTMPGNAVLDLAASDLAIHTADLARATGQTIADDEMAEAALALAQRVIQPGYRMPGVFAAEHTAAPDAPPADRLLAFAGRSV